MVFPPVCVCVGVGVCEGVCWWCVGVRIENVIRINCEMKPKQEQKSNKQATEIDADSVIQ